MRFAQPALIGGLLLLAGCTGQGETNRRMPRLDPSVDRPIRVASDSLELWSRVQASGVSFPIAPDGGRAVERDGHCWKLRPPAEALDAGLTATDWELAWQGRLQSEDSESAWLLDGIVGVASFVRGATKQLAVAEQRRGRVKLCAAWTDEDVALRLSHFSLWAMVGTPPRPAVQVESGGSPVLALARGTLDLALLDREQMRALHQANDPRLGAVAAPLLARTYWLVFAPRARWVNDPRVRRWLAQSTDRRLTADVVTGDPEDACFDLLCTGDLAAEAEPERFDRPLAQTSRPRVDLAVDGRDRSALALASRLQAAWHELGIDILVREQQDSAAVEKLYRDSETSMALVVHRAEFADRLLALESTLRRVGGALAPESSAVRTYRRSGDPTQRLAWAKDWDAELRDQGLVLPLLHDPVWIGFRRDGIVPTWAVWGGLQLDAGARR